MTEKENTKIVVINAMFTNFKSHLQNEKSLLISLFLPRIISNTVEKSKHKFFIFVSTEWKELSYFYNWYVWVNK